MWQRLWWRAVVGGAVRMWCRIRAFEIMEQWRVIVEEKELIYDFNACIVVLFTLCDSVVLTPKGAKFLVAMVAHVICSCGCMICEHKPPDCHEVLLPAAWLLLSPQTDHYTDSDSRRNAFERTRRASSAEAWTGCTITRGYVMSAYVIYNHASVYIACHAYVMWFVSNSR